MTKDYGEIICTAVDEIVRARISSLEFNVTKTCTIIDISSRKQGKYGVSDGSVSFIALSEDTTYNLDDSVLVLIPNGDYKNDKLILSKINKDTELPYNYTSPMSMMVTLTDNVLNNLKYGSGLLAESGGLLANEPAAVDEKIGTSVVLYDFNQNLDQLNGFTRIGLSVDFKSLLSNLNVHSGTYGVFIEIHSKVGKQGVEKDLVTILPFDCNEMVGNPYNFTSFFTQEKVFDISYIQNIQSIQVVFYQGADFKDAQGALVPYQYKEFPSNKTNNYSNNLFVSNVKMYFGQGVNEFDKETITLYTNDMPSYHYTRDNEKTLNIRWVHKINDNTYMPLSEIGLDTSKYEVRWYRYNSATTNIDEYAGEGWERIDGLAANAFSIKFTPNIKNVKEKIKVIGIVRDGSVVPYASNILELINEEYVPDQAVFDISSGLSIGCLDDTAGNYYLYDQNGYLNNSGLGQGYTRVMAPLWNGVQIDYDTFSGKKVDFVEWWFPASGTMTICEEKDTQLYNGIQYKVFRYVPGADWGKNDITFDYSIKNYWAKKESNNTIRCVISINGTEYSAVKELQFGRAGSNGTNLTMVLEFSGNNNALIIGEGSIEVEARLYDSNGSRIDFTKDQATNGITWGWYKSTPADEDDDAYMWHSENEDNATRTIILNSTLNEPPTDNYFILQATYQADILATELTAFLPIPIKVAECSHIEGAKEVIYNHQGVPSYYKDAYKAFKRENKEYEEYKNLVWTCTSTNNDDALTPHLSNCNSGGLVAPQFFVDGQSDQVCVHCNYWSQPVLIMQSKYDFALLNSWDESLTIDENNGTILSTMLGAGKKVNNVFSGVLIGDLVAGTDLLTAPRNTGVYGFHGGQMSFGFKDDGTAFVGKSGMGQISFDGNLGLIKSPGWSITHDSDGYEYVPVDKGSIWNLTNGDFILQKSNDEYFKFTNDGLSISLQKLTVNAGNWDDGRLFLSNQSTSITKPSASGAADNFFVQSYFALGTNNNYLAFSKNGLRLQLFNENAHSGISFSSDDDAGLVITSNKLSIGDIAGYNLSSTENQILIQHTTTQLASFNKDSITLQNSGASLSSVASSKSLSGVYLYPHWGGAWGINLTDSSGTKINTVTLVKDQTSVGYLSPSGTKVNGKYAVYYTDGGTILNGDSYSTQAALNTLDISALKIGYVTGEYGNWLINKGSFTIVNNDTSTDNQGSSLQLSNAGYMFFSKSGDNKKGIFIGNLMQKDGTFSDYALQIGSFRVKWDGTVEGISTPFNN